MRNYCNNEDEHRQDARRDFNRGGSNYYDRDYYDKYSSDACKQAYTEEFDKAQMEHDRIEEERQAVRQQEEIEAHRRRDREEAERAEQEYYEALQHQEYMDKMLSGYNENQPCNTDDLPF